MQRYQRMKEYLLLTVTPPSPPVYAKLISAGLLLLEGVVLIATNRWIPVDSP